MEHFYLNKTIRKVALGLLLALLNIGQAVAGNAEVIAKHVMGSDAIAPAGYSVAFDQPEVNSSNADSVTFTITWPGFEVNAYYAYSITDGQGNTVSNDSTDIDSEGLQSEPIDLTGFSDTLLILTVAVLDSCGNIDSLQIDTATVAKDAAAPTGYAVAFDTAVVNIANQATIGLVISGGEAGATYALHVVDSESDSVSSTNILAAAADTIVLDLSSLADGNLTARLTLTDTAGNAGNEVTSGLTKDTQAPIVAALTAGSANPNDGTTVTYLLDFNEDVNGLALADFELQGDTAVTNSASIVNLTSSDDSTYTVDVTGFTPPGTLTLRLVDDDGITDDAGNALAGAADGSFTGVSYSIILAEPAEHPGNFTVTDSSSTSLTVSWTEPTTPATGYLVIARDTSGTFEAPADGTDLAVNDTDFSDGNAEVRVLSDTTEVAFTGLQSGVVYEFEVFSFNNTGTDINYKDEGTTGVAPFATATTEVDSATTVSGGGALPTVTSLNNTTPGDTLFVFTVTDDDGNPATDNAPTKFNTLTFTQGSGNDVTNWQEALAGAVLADDRGNTQTANIAIGSNTITVSNISTSTNALGNVDDNGSVIYYLSAWLRDSLQGSLPGTIDGQNLVFAVANTGFTIDNSGGLSSNFVAGSSTTSGSTNNAVDVSATALAFTTEPLPTTIGVADTFSTTPVVAALDANNNIDLDYNEDVTVTNAGGLGMANTPDAAIAGVVTFASSFAYTEAGDGTLTVTDTVSATTDAVSNAITVALGDNTTLSAGPDAEPDTISSLQTGATLQVFDFTLTDDDTGVTTDDALPTLVTDMVISAAAGNEITDWTQAIAEAVLTDGANTAVAGTVTDSLITFASLSTGVNDMGYVADDQAKTWQLNIRLQPGLQGSLPATIDNLHFEFAIDPAAITLASAGSSQLAGGAAVSSGSSSGQVIVEATELAFTTQPPDTAFVNANLGTTPVVTARDANGNTDLDFTDNLTVTNSGGLAMLNVNTTPVSGVLTFNSSFQYTEAGNGTLGVSGTGVSAVSSNSVAVLLSDSSDVVEDATFTYPENIDYLAQVTDDIDADTGLVVARFVLRDGGAFTDADGTGTTLTGLQLAIGNGNQLQRVALYDGATELAEVAGSATPQFSGLTFTAADNSSDTLSVVVSFNTTVTDNTVLTVAVTGVTAQSTASTFAAVNGGGASTTLAGDDNRLEVTASQYDFTTQPSANALAGIALTQQPVVAARDVNGNTDVDFATAISVTNSGTLGADNVPTAISGGVLSFAGYTYTETGSATITVSGGGITDGTSTSTTVTASGQADLVAEDAFTTPENIAYENYQATDVEADANSLAIAQFTLRDGGSTGTDPDGAPTILTDITFDVVNSNNLRRIALYLDTTELAELDAAATFTASGLNVTAPDNDSVTLTVRVSFADVVTDNAQVGVQVTAVQANAAGSAFATADGGGAASVTTGDANRIEVTATQFVFTTEPPATAGVLIDLTQTPEAETQDALGNIDVDYGGDVTTTSLDGIVLNNAPDTIESGVVTFAADLQYTDNGDGTLVLDDGSLANDTSTTVTVTYADNTVLTAGTDAEPTTVSALQNSTLLQVFDFTLTDDASGVVVDDGVATQFSQVVVQQGSGNEVTDWSALLAEATLTDGTNTAISGTIGATTITFSSIPYATGEMGHVADDASKTWQLNVRLLADLDDALAAVVDGQNLVFSVDDADFTLRSDSTSTLAAVAAVTSGSTNNEVTVVATELVFTTQPPATVFVDANLDTIPVVAARDANGNTDLDFTQAITVANAGSLNMINVNTTPVAGVLTFNSNFQYTDAGNGTLGVTSAGLSSATSNAVAVVFANGSDVVNNGSFAYPENIDYINRQATDIAADTNSVAVAQFVVRDGGASNDLDGTATDLTGMRLAISNAANLRRVALYNGTTELAEADAADTVAFTGFTFTAPDDGADTLTVRVSYAATVTDNAVNGFTVVEVQASAVTSAFAAADGGGAASTQTGDENKIEVTATQIDFTTEVPAVNNVLVNLSTAPVVEARDANANTDLDYTAAIDSVTNTLDLGMLNTPVGDSFVSGALTFDANFQFTADGTGVELLVYSGALTPATSQTFDVVAATASDIVLDTAALTDSIAYINFQADSITNSNAFTLATFVLRDGGGNTDIDGAVTVLDNLTLQIENAANVRRLAVYDGTTVLEQVAGSGTVNFTNLGITAPDDGTFTFTVLATFEATVTDNDRIGVRISSATNGGGSFFGAANAGGAQTIDGFNIMNVQATEIAFTTQPDPHTGINLPLDSAVQVAAFDALGNLDLNFNRTSVGIVPAGAATLVNAPTTIVAGIMEFPGFTYGSTGLGALTVSTTDAFGSAITVTSSRVDVINTNLDGNVLDLETNITPLLSGAVNKALLGFRLRADTRSQADTVPTLQQIRVHFNQDVQGLLTNLRIVFSEDNRFQPTDLLNQITPQLVPQTANQFLTFTNVGQQLKNEFLNQTFFVVADVDLLANINTDTLQLFIDSLSFVTDEGSFSGAPVFGPEFIFLDNRPPQLSSTYPENNEQNIPLDTVVVLAFDEPVRNLENTIELYEFLTNNFVANLVLDSIRADSTQFLYDIPNGLLQGNTRYYVQVPAANEAQGVGFVDRSGNNFAGINGRTDFRFETSDLVPPTFVDSAVVNVYDVGFDLRVQLNEAGRVHYIITTAGEPVPGSAAEIRDTATYAGTVVEAGTINVTRADADHFAAIFDLASSQSYAIYFTAQDAAQPTPNLSTEIAVLTATTTAAASAGVLVQAPDLDLCVGDFQNVLAPISIVEGDAADFGVGNDQTFNLILPQGFEFDVDNTEAEALAPDNRNIVGGSNGVALTYLNNTTLRLTYSVDSTHLRDRIVITGLQIKALGPLDAPPTGVVRRLGGTAIMNGNAEGDNVAHATLTTTGEVFDAFTTVPDAGTFILEDNPAILLLPPPDVESFIFDGNGVVGDSLFTEAAGTGIVTITMTAEDAFGCTADISRDLTIINAADAITGLASQYCTDDGQVAIPFIGRGDNFVLDTLVFDTLVLNDPAQFTTAQGAIIQNSLNLVDTTNELLGYTFEPANFLVNEFNRPVGDAIALPFVAVYRSLLDQTQVDTTVLIVELFDPAEVEIIVSDDETPQLENGFCVDSDPITLTGFSNSINAELSSGTFSLLAGSNAAFLTDNGNGTATLDPINGRTVADTVVVLYTFINAAGCASTDTATLLINPLPDLEILHNDILFDGNIAYCVDNDPLRLTGFDSTAGVFIPVGAFFGDGVTGGEDGDGDAIFSPRGAVGPVLNVSTDVDIRLEYTDSVTGCFNQVTNTVRVNPLPVPTLAFDSQGPLNNTNYCLENAEVSITGSVHDSIISFRLFDVTLAQDTLLPPDRYTVTGNSLTAVPRSLLAGSIFNDSRSFEARYVIADGNQCENDASIQFLINPPTPVTIDVPLDELSYCEGDDDIELSVSDLVGGIRTFSASGPGLTDNREPDGTATATFAFNDNFNNNPLVDSVFFQYENTLGCISGDTVVLTTNPKPVLSVTYDVNGPLDSLPTRYCLVDEDVTVTGFSDGLPLVLAANSSNVSFEGVPQNDGFDDNGDGTMTFNLEQVANEGGVGDQNYQFTYTNLATGCADTIVETFTIQPLPVPNFTPIEVGPLGDFDDYCIDGDSIILFGTFDNIDSLTSVFTVNGLPAADSITFNNVMAVVPADFAASTGDTSIQHTFEFIFTAAATNGCVGTSSLSLNINPLTPVAIEPPVGDDFVFCEGDEAVVLTAPVENILGFNSFSGPGIGATNINGNEASAEFNINTAYNGAMADTTVVVTYTFTDDNGCVSINTQEILINPLPNLDLVFDYNGPLGGQRYCFDRDQDTIVVQGFADGDSVEVALFGDELNLAYAPGFTTLNGFTDNGDGSATLLPTEIATDAGNQNRQFTYDITLEYIIPATGCADTITESFDILPLPDASLTFNRLGEIGNNQDYCVDGTLIGINSELENDSTEAIGQYIVSGFLAGDSLITADSISFLPADYFALAGQGNMPRPIQVEFSAIDRNGCTGITERSFNINPLPAPSIEIQDNVTEYCQNESELIELTGFPASETGSVFSGSGVSDLGDGEAELNIPLAYGANSGDSIDITISYSYTDAKGCRATALRNVRIQPVPILDFTALGACAGLPTLFTAMNSANALIANWNWNFNDGTENELTPFDTINHTFDEQGIFNVGLTATTIKGCVNDAYTENVRIGPVPEVDFVWNNVCAGDSIAFTGAINIDVPGDTTVNYQWSFGNGTFRSQALPEATSFINEVIYPNALIQGDSIGAYEVTFSAVTGDQCGDTTSKMVAILPVVNSPLNADTLYFVNFGVDQNTWLAATDLTEQPAPFDTLSSPLIAPTWAFDATEAVWATNTLGAAYSPREQSWVYSPCFDLSVLSRPMLSMSVWTDLASGDGVVVQTSTNNGQTWETLGQFEDNTTSGLNWYNEQSVAGSPGSLGGGSNAGNYGFSDEFAAGWQTVRHDLEPVSGRENVRFRIALGAASDNELGNIGFAFDSVMIGERPRTVVLEQFVNMGTADADAAEVNIIELLNTIPNDVAPVFYHADFPNQQDPLNVRNTLDPGGRRTLYGLNDVPYSVIDGGADSVAGFTFDGFSILNDPGESLAWDAQDVLIRTLVEPEVTLDVTLGNAGPEVLTVDVTVAALVEIDTSSRLHVAVIEREIAASQFGGTTTNNQHFALIKMLPNAGGTGVPSMAVGETANISLSYEVRNAFEIDSLVVVVFLQNNETQEVLQAALVDASGLGLEQVTGLVAGGELAETVLYPNPANRLVNALFGQPLSQPMAWQVINIHGVPLQQGQLTAGSRALQVDTSQMPSGVYFLMVQGQQDAFARIRFMVKH